MLEITGETVKKENSTVTVEEAIELILNSIKPLSGEKVSILEADGRALYEDIVSNIDIPPLDNSAMDGYTVIAQDTKGASKENPIKLSVTGEIQAGGDYLDKIVKSGTAVRIMTGAPIPKGADAVIMVEYTSEESDIVSIFRDVKKGENIRLAGEDIRKDSVVLTKGERLKSADIGLLASLNYKSVMVYRSPDVAIISTGDEIAEIGEDISPGQIRNSNSYTLYSDLKRYNAIPHYLGIARDTFEETKEKFIQALKCDIILTTGGVSMGKYDFVKDVIADLGIEIMFSWIRMKPGRPCIFGTMGNKLFFGLPGNPVSTMISFVQFVRPAILRMMGAERIKKPVVSAILREDIRKKPDRTNFIRGIFTVEDGEFYVTTTGLQGSGILSSMSVANCLIIIPQGIASVDAGDRVSIQLIYHEELA